MKLIKNTLLATLLLSVIIILFFNLINYDVIKGYDGEAHARYVDGFFAIYIPGVSDQTSEEITREHYSPPLPYLIPAVINNICKNNISSIDKYRDCQPIYGNFIQVINSLLYLFTIYFYYLSFKKIFNEDFKHLLLIVILVFSVMSVNYKSISMLRGEVYITFFLSILIYELVKIEEIQFNNLKNHYFRFGILIGLLTLSRQWSIFLYPGLILSIYLYGFKKDNLSEVTKFLSKTFTLAILISGWFYLKLYLDYGTFTKFNINEMPFRFFNQPMNFYFPTLNQIVYLFTNPTRPNLDNQFLTIMYADFWGDYWGYFLYNTSSFNESSNLNTIGNYLGKVNLFSIFASSVFITSIFFAKPLYNKLNSNRYTVTMNFIFFGIVFSILGYLYFLIKYPSFPSGDTIKATYLLQLFHLIGFNTIFIFNYLKNRKTMYYFLLFIFISTFIFNSYTYITY